MTLAAMAGVSSTLAACGAGSASSTPSSAPSSGASAPASSEPTASPSAAASQLPLESDLYLFNWSDYFADDNKKAFEDRFKVNITYDTYPSNEELLAKLQAGGKGGQFGQWLVDLGNVERVLAEGLVGEARSLRDHDGEGVESDLPFRSPQVPRWAQDHG